MCVRSRQKYKQSNKQGRWMGTDSRACDEWEVQRSGGGWGGGWECHLEINIVI